MLFMLMLKMIEKGDWKGFESLTKARNEIKISRVCMFDYKEGKIPKFEYSTNTRSQTGVNAWANHGLKREVLGLEHVLHLRQVVLWSRVDQRVEWVTRRVPGYATSRSMGLHCNRQQHLHLSSPIKNFVSVKTFQWQIGFKTIVQT